MDLGSCIDIIISQERSEIKSYTRFAEVVILLFFGLLCFNILSNHIKDIVPASTNFLTLAVSYIPFQQIIKRKKKILFFHKIVRLGLSQNDPDKDKFDEIILEAVKEASK